jgi:hypothetical protein
MTETIIWRIVSWRKVGGGMNWWGRTYVHDDLVSTERLPEYLMQLEKMGIEDAKIERKGPISWVLENLHFEPRPGTTSLKPKNHKLEDYE